MTEILHAESVRVSVLAANQWPEIGVRKPNSAGFFTWTNNKLVTVRLACLFETAIYLRYSRKLPIRKAMK